MLTIDELRVKLEETDACIIAKLAERQELSRQIGQIKIGEGLSITNRAQEEKLFQNYEQLCKKHQLPYLLIKKLFKIIMSHSKTIQKNQMVQE